MKQSLKNFYKSHPELREKYSKLLKEQNKNPEFRKKALYAIRNTRPTSAEQKVIDIIKKYRLPFEYTGNGKYWICYKSNNFNPDFVCKEKMLIIEVFSSYWHTLSKAKKRDKIRRIAYKENGYNFLIVWSDELDNNINKTEKKIFDFYKNENSI